MGASASVLVTMFRKTSGRSLPGRRIVISRYAHYCWSKEDHLNSHNFKTTGKENSTKTPLYIDLFFFFYIRAAVVKTFTSKKPIKVRNLKPFKKNKKIFFALACGRIFVFLFFCFFVLFCFLFKA